MTSLIVTEQPQVELVTDASGSWGCGAVCGTKWFQLNWVRAKVASEWSIMPKEMLPIVIAAAVWGPQWRGLTVRVKCDNMAVVATIRSGSCKERNTMHMRRCLAFLEAVGMFVLVAEYIKGEDNVVTDALSRNNLSLAWSVLQDAAAMPERVPQALVELVMTPILGWSEQQWDDLQSFTFARD